MGWYHHSRTAKAETETEGDQNRPPSLHHQDHHHRHRQSLRGSHPDHGDRLNLGRNRDQLREEPEGGVAPEMARETETKMNTKMGTPQTPISFAFLSFFFST